jgi:hypothetical protein
MPVSLPDQVKPPQTSRPHTGSFVLAIKKAALKTWEQLKDQKICAIQGCDAAWSDVSCLAA